MSTTPVQHLDLPDLHDALQNEVMEWVAHYEGGYYLTERSGAHFQDIEQDRIQAFVLAMTPWAQEQGYAIPPISFSVAEESRRLVFTRRRKQRYFFSRPTLEGLIPVWHYTITICGWQEQVGRRNVQHLVGVMPGGSLLMTDDATDFELPHNDPTSDDGHFDPECNPWDRPWMGGVVVNMEGPK